MTPHTLLLDSDIIAFKVAASTEERYDFDGDGTLTQFPSTMETIGPLIDEAVAGFMMDLKGTRAIVCLSCPSADCFRLDYLPTYKGNRVDAMRPVMLAATKQYMADKYETYKRPRLEADDVMGILSTHPKLIKGRKTIVSEDKDMQTIPGWWYNPRKREMRLVSESEANRYHMLQTLTGDPTDNYKGAPGIGPKKAEKILDGCNGRYWPEVCETFAHRLGVSFIDGQEAALVQARCARILQYTDYNFTTKEVIPWSPK